MTNAIRPSVCAFSLCVVTFCGLVSTHAQSEKVLFDFDRVLDRDFDVAAVESRDARATLSPGREGTALRVATGHEQAWPGVTLVAPDGRWDLSAFGHLLLDVENVGANPVEVSCRIDSPLADGTRHFYQESISLAPGEKNTLRVTLKRRMPPELEDKLFGMRGFPGGMVKDQGIDPANVDQLLLYVARPTEDHVFQVDNIRAGGSVNLAEGMPTDPGAWFPMIDRYGQFIHKDWPGKTKSPDDFCQRQEAEAADLAAHSRPGDWNGYGGWAAGPELEATGHFRAAKHQGQWWLVDPEGRLFWSHGIDCVRPNNATTPITDREHWFDALPGRDDPFGQFLGRGNWAPRDYYQGRGYETYNFTGANLLRKYGADWQPTFAGLCHRRLESWGMNTIANWSDQHVYLMRRTPYVVSISVGAKSIEGSSGFWRKFPDPFDPEFTASLRGRLAQEVGKSAGDPWCIGYFVDNELSWGDDLSLAIATLASPPEQAAKRVFVDDLAAKYTTIQRLNETWGTEHASWAALRTSQTPPDQEKAAEDLAAFYTKTARQYFRGCRQAVKQVAPENLYLGCRFAWVNDRAVLAAAEFCDVVSFNRYRYTVADFELPSGVDMPCIIGEFHFGALDRGMFHTGLKAAANQQERAEMYADYVRGALENPWLVGTHWFQYGDQATTGRGDGENYQIGFLDVCDTPYQEIIQASREIGATMYRLRSRSGGSSR